jgi:hypothetical protein
MAPVRTVVILSWVALSSFARADALDQWMTRTSPVPFTATDISMRKACL